MEDVPRWHKFGAGELYWAQYERSSGILNPHFFFILLKKSVKNTFFSHYRKGQNGFNFSKYWWKNSNFLFWRSLLFFLWEKKVILIFFVTRSKFETPMLNFVPKKPRFFFLRSKKLKIRKILRMKRKWFFSFLCVKPLWNGCLKNNNWFWKSIDFGNFGFRPSANIN